MSRQCRGGVPAARSPLSTWTLSSSSTGLSSRAARASSTSARSPLRPGTPRASGDSWRGRRSPAAWGTCA
eukprot:3858291-Alexandrium_andersonii.AAC.1